MKSPDELAAVLARQWQQADQREQRLLSAQAWPLTLAIGHPSAKQFAQHTAAVRAHVQRWRALNVGEVSWEVVVYRCASEPVELPVRWCLRSPSEWVRGTFDTSIQHEYHRLEQMVADVDPVFHRVLLRRPSLLRERTNADIVRATKLALALEPGCAHGKPLRALAINGIDSKFFERHRALIITLLDVIFDGQVSAMRLEPFLGALDDNDHWLLIVPLQKNRLPFTQQRVRASELLNTPLPASRILLIENERCLHQLPALDDTIAILGAGLNLSWLCSPQLAGKNMAYWGDIDTWGLLMLAKARALCPGLHALLMQKTVFIAHKNNAVNEPSIAGPQAPAGLTEAEAELYVYLTTLARGRLEQEFLPAQLVKQALREWASDDVKTETN